MTRELSRTNIFGFVFVALMVQCALRRHHNEFRYPVLNRDEGLLHPLRPTGFPGDTSKSLSLPVLLGLSGWISMLYNRHFYSQAANRYSSSLCINAQATRTFLFANATEARFFPFFSTRPQIHLLNGFSFLCAN